MSHELPPAGRVPKNTAGLQVFTIEQYRVASWGPLPDGKGPSTEVHVLFELKGGGPPLCLRIKSAAEADRLIAALQRHRFDVWPGG